MPAASAETRPPWRFFGLVAAILTVRLLVAADLHLSEDEAYYRLWSMAPAFGYYDHPPMIAWWIAIGRAMVGDTPLGVRLLPAIGSAVSSLLVFDMARLATGDQLTAERAAVWFNCTLLVACGAFLAVPDAPASLFWCLTLWAVLKAGGRRSIGWWLLAGAAAGLATLSKYSALFLGPGLLLWLMSSADGRRALRTPGPWLALIVAAGLFGLNLNWNATHHWLTFQKQFGRVTPHGWTWRYLPELVATQIVLLNPAVALLLLRRRRATKPTWFFVASSLPFAGYLVLHSLHDRVQAHWPAPLYPTVAILAAIGATRLKPGFWRGLRIAVPAIAICAVLALGVLVALPPSTFAGSADLFLPLRGWRSFSVSLDRTRSETDASWIGTTSYGLASELRDERLSPVVQIRERDRWHGLPSVPQPNLSRPGLVVDLPRRLDLSRLQACFRDVEFLGNLPRGAAGERPTLYGVYRVAGSRVDLIREGCR